MSKLLLWQIGSNQLSSLNYFKCPKKLKQELENHIFPMSHTEILVYWVHETPTRIRTFFPSLENNDAAQFYWNTTYMSIPGKISEWNSNVPIFSNPGARVKKTGQICPVVFLFFRTLSPGLEYIDTSKYNFKQIPGMLTFQCVVVQGTRS